MTKQLSRPKISPNMQVSIIPNMRNKSGDSPNPTPKINTNIAKALIFTLPSKGKSKSDPLREHVQQNCHCPTSLISKVLIRTSGNSLKLASPRLNHAIMANTLIFPLHVNIFMEIISRSTARNFPRHYRFPASQISKLLIRKSGSATPQSWLHPALITQAVQTRWQLPCLVSLGGESKSTKFEVISFSAKLSLSNLPNFQNSNSKIR